MDIFIPIFIFFTIFVLCSLCGFCCKKQEEGAIYSTPVVITSQTHQPVGAPSAYPVQNSTVVVQSRYQTVVVPPTGPMPYSDSAPPYPTNAPYTGSRGMPFPQPYGQQTVGYPSAMYPPQSAPYHPQSGPHPQQPAPTQSAPYPPQTTMEPPAYNEVIANQAYQKQAPYNPNFSG